MPYLRAPRSHLIAEIDAGHHGVRFKSVVIDDIRHLKDLNRPVQSLKIGHAYVRDFPFRTAHNQNKFSAFT